MFYYLLKLDKTKAKTKRIRVHDREQRQGEEFGKVWPLQRRHSLSHVFLSCREEGRGGVRQMQLENERKLQNGPYRGRMPRSAQWHDRRGAHQHVHH